MWTNQRARLLRDRARHVIPNRMYGHQSTRLWSVVGSSSSCRRTIACSSGGERANLAAATVLIAAAVMIAPGCLLADLAASQLFGIYGAVATGRIDLTRYFDAILNLLSAPLRSAASNNGYGGFASAQSHLVTSLSDQVDVLAGHAAELAGSTLGLIVSITVTRY